MGLGETRMKGVVKVSDGVRLARRFRAEPLVAMQAVVAQVRTAVAETVERVMDAENDRGLGGSGDPANECDVQVLTQARAPTRFAQELAVESGLLRAQDALVDAGGHKRTRRVPRLRRGVVRRRGGRPRGAA